jgi:uncharacterized BrkB/YihY/UPF0761 family membrane protein
VSSEHLGIVVCLAVALWLGYDLVQAIRTGTARASSFTFSRDQQPSQFWTIVAIQALVFLILITVAATQVLP